MSPQVWYPIYDIITFTALITNQFATSTFIQVDISKGQNMSDPALLMKKNEQHKSAQNCLVGHLHLSILSWPSSWSARSDWLMNKIGDRKMGQLLLTSVGITWVSPLPWVGRLLLLFAFPKLLLWAPSWILPCKNKHVYWLYIYIYVSCWLLYVYI